MNELMALIRQLIDQERLVKGVISNRQSKSETECEKWDIKPIRLKTGLHYQWSCRSGNKILHENLTPQDTAERMGEKAGQYRQMLLCTPDEDHQVLISRKGKAKLLKHAPTHPMADLSHNRKKEHILKEGTPYPFLVHLGVMTEEGKVKSKRYDKFKQLNRYLEMIRDIVDALDSPQVRIVDFGCGKAYLTFALYHYLVEELGMEAEIIGLDLKEDVVDFGNAVARAVGFEHLRFERGDIQSFSSTDPVDMVISLHACDTATDDALIKGIAWQAKVLLAVPCCQHELYPRIQSEALNGLLKYGIYRERIAALLTDALRAGLLEQAGYKVDAVEFIAMEHTAKNIMLRAVHTGTVKEDALQEYEALKQAFGITGFHMEKNR